MTTKSHHRLKSSLGYKTDDDIYTVGLLIYSQLQKTDQNLIEHRFAKLAQTYKFKRVYFHGQVIQSKEYTAVKKRNSFTVQYSCQNGALCLGHAKYYVRCSFQCPSRLHCDKGCLCQSEQYLAVIERKQVKNEISLSSDEYTGATIPHIVPVDKVSELTDIIRVTDIKSMCISISIVGQQSDFIVRFPNFIEKD